MAISKKYFHDHLVMLLLSINVFLAVGGSLILIISLSTGHSNGYIVQCRDCSNPAAVNKFTNGSVSGLLSFVVFAALVLVSHTILSLGILLLVLMIIISNSLLVLR